MISKSLKVGDLFTDGNFEYKVLSLTETPGVYVSQVVGSAKKPTTKEAVKSSEEQEKPVKKIKKIVTE